MTGLLILLVSAWLPNAPARFYEHKEYEAALEAYREQAAQDKTNWPLQYNLGAAAYRAGKFEEAAEAFERALGTQDQELQARALYNLGNSQFRIGESLEAQGSQQALPAYQQALRSYEQALAVTPTDADAEFNRDLVKRKIEELQQQQQQQENEKPQEQEKDKQQQNGEDRPQDKQQDQESAKEPEQSGDQPQQPENSSQEQPQPADQETQKPSPTAEPHDYQQIEAKGLLDRLREQERTWNFYPELEKQLNNEDKPAKDW